MPKYHLHHIEFYITNVCNLTCSDCRTFNNYKFKGHYTFNPELYKPWADLIEIDSFEILGGEPTLHPKLFEWMAGLRKLWPNATGNLVTNGTYLSRVKDLHKIAAEYNYNIKVGMHSNHLRPLIADEILSAFGDCRMLPIQKSTLGDFVNLIHLETDLGVQIKCQSYEHFQTSPFKNKNFEFYNSNPIIAHHNCHMKSTHHMVDGKLYKCGFMATGSNFLQQQKLPPNELLDSYQPLTIENIQSQADVDRLKNYIPQCSLCSEQNQIIKMTSSLKNKKIFKIHSL